MASYPKIIDVTTISGEVSPVIFWYRVGHFRSEEEARGAFRLAHQQGLDGMGKSVRQWMGMTDEEFDAWMRHDALPPLKPQRSKRRSRI